MPSFTRGIRIEIGISAVRTDQVAVLADNLEGKARLDIDVMLRVFQHHRITH